MITYQITNTTLQDGDLIVFFEFSNGEINSNRFKQDDSVADIQQWGADRAKFFDQREALLREQLSQLMPDPSVEDSAAAQDPQLIAPEEAPTQEPTTQDNGSINI